MTDMISKIEPSGHENSIGDGVAYINTVHFDCTLNSLVTYIASCSVRLMVSLALMSPLALAGSSWPSASGLCSVVATWFSKLAFSSFKFCKK